MDHKLMISMRTKRYVRFDNRTLKVFDGREEMPVGREAIPLGMNRNVIIWSSDDLVGIASPDNLAAVGWKSLDTIITLPRT